MTLPRSAPSGTSAIPVGRFVAAARLAIERTLGLAWVSGEVSGFLRAASGHCYFTLKDAQAQVRCVLWRQKAQLLDLRLADGMAVEVRATPTLYEARGDFQLVVDTVRLAGRGTLHEQFERLKAKLEAAGWFAAGRKRALPPFPRAVGLVTSPQGAALHDMLTTFAARWPALRIVLYPSPVQGDGAAERIAEAIRTANARAEVDLLIVGRGGGSIEDLWAFNEEAVARAIQHCPVPVISAVGHEGDVTIADFVADRRAPTPSAAAEIVVSAKDEFCGRIDRLRHRLDAAMTNRIQSSSRRVHIASSRPALAGFPTRLAMRGRDVTELSHRLHQQARAAVALRRRRLDVLRRTVESFDLGRRMQAIRTRLATCDGRLHAGIDRRRARADARLRERIARLESLSPLAVLSRGYAVAWNDERTRALRDARDVDAGDRIRVTLAHGELQCDVRARHLAGNAHPAPTITEDDV